MDGHPRDDVMDAAARELLPWLKDWKLKYELQSSEFLSILLTYAARHLAAIVVAEREGITPTPKSQTAAGG